jgi:hypothetical protein
MDDAAVEVDWKAEAAEVLGALRERFGGEFSALASPTLDELVMNYSTEMPTVSLLAIGQELESLGLLLHEVSSDSDSYILLVTAAGEKSSVPTSGLKLLRQARRRAGAPAKRFNLADRLPYRRASEYLGTDELVVGQRMLMVPHFQYPDRWVDLSDVWPPAITLMQSNLQSVAVNLDATIVAATTELDVLVLVIGDPSTPVQDWDVIDAFSGLTKFAHLGFHGDDLFILSQGSAWRIPNAVNGGREVTRIVKTSARHEMGPSRLVHSGDERCWLLIGGRIYEWTGRKLRRTRLPLRTPASAGVPTAKGFAYIASGALIELDTSTGKEQSRPLAGIFGTSILALDQDWTVILTRGNLSRENDLVQLWNRSTDEWLRLPYGILGPEIGIRSMLCTPDGSVWTIYAGSIFDLGPLDELIPVLRARNDCAVLPLPFGKSRRRFTLGM